MTQFNSHLGKLEPGRVKMPRAIHHGGWLLVCSVLLSACVQPLLNSERIQHQFGSYGVEVLENSRLQRISNLYSLEGERKICRTLALVTFEDPSNAAIADEHRKIIAGGSIGAVFKENGWTIHKINLHMGSVTVTAKAGLIAHLMAVPLPTKLAMHVYRFQLQRGHEHVNYAIITEIHHPDYLSVEHLESLYSAFPSESLSGPALAAIESEVRHTLLQ